VPAPEEAEAQRLFFALWPDETTRRQVADLVDSLPRRQGRATPVANLHVTLAFVGRTSPGGRLCLEHAASEVQGQPFTLHLDRVGYFARRRILWLGPSETPLASADLAADLQRRLAPCGYEPERRAFRPHITLMRKSRPPPEGLQPEPIDWRVEQFALVESVLSPAGAEYHVLRNFPLVSEDGT